MPSVYCHSVEDILWDKVYNGDFTLNSNVDIWRILISSNLHLIDDFGQILSSDERGRTSRYHQEKDRQRFIVSRVALRFLLATYSNNKPDSIEFEVSVNKKPFLKNSITGSLCFNVSHSSDIILIAISDSDIGTDVEMIDEVFSYAEILQQNFSNEEIAFITEGNHQQSENFYLLWTRKEALLKATSKGIDSDLPFIPSLDGIHNADQEIIGSDKDFHVSSFKIADNYIGTVAYAPGNENIRFRDINEFSFSD